MQMAGGYDERFLRKALAQAHQAAAEDETPIGAVVVKDGIVVGRGRNQRERRQDVTLHAEMSAIRQASRKLGSWRLDDCDLYVTLEPCPMCAGAIQQARFRAVYYGARDPKAGACGSKTNLFAVEGLNHYPEIVGGCLEDECAAVLKGFFKEMRARDKSLGTRGVRRDKAKAKTT
jgi:tRNA(adenine34) deaminase